MIVKGSLLGGKRRCIPEVILALLVLAGFINCIYRYMIDGKLPQPFIFDINDTFMDWFNTAMYAHNPGAFDVWKTVYPPISFVFLSIFGNPSCYAFDPVSARNCDVIGISTIVICYIAAALFAWRAFVRNDPTTGHIRGLSFAFGLPLLFTLERGNLILPCFVFFVIGYAGLTKSRLIKAISIGITINFKPYLLVPVLARIFKREWRFLEISGIATIGVYLTTFSIFGSGSPQQLYSNTLNWITFTNGLIWEGVYYSTSYLPFMEFNSYRFPTRDFLPSSIIDNMVILIPAIIKASQALAIICLAAVWTQPQAVSRERISLLLLAISQIGSSPGGYAETFLVFLLFLEPWKRIGPIIAIVMGYLLCVPYDYVVSNFITLTGTAWLSGRQVIAPFGVAIGIFVRPGLIVFLFWALAADTLVQVVRAYRLSRPVFGFRPKPVDARLATG